MWKMAVAALLLAGSARAQPALDYRAANETLSRTAPACVVDAASGGERLLLVGASTPLVMSDLVLAGRDLEAQAVTLRIEPGADRFHLAIAAEDGIVYVVDDPTDRIHRLQLLSVGNLVAGVAGVPRERVSLVDMSGCAGADLSRHLGNAALAGNRESEWRIGAMFGRLPEMVALRDARSAGLPSGALDRPPAENQVIFYAQGSRSTTRTVYVVRPDGRTARQPSLVYSQAEIGPDLLGELDNALGGILIIDPATVVSTHPVARSARMAPFRNARP